MERHFAIPITFAAAAHAALLFGFTKPPVSVSPPPARHRPIPDEVVQILPDDPVVVAAVESVDRVSAPERPPPTGRTPEPELVAPGPVPIMTVPVWGVFDPGRVLNLGVLPGTTGPVGNGKWAGSVLPAALDNPPRTRFQAAPLYPFEAKNAGLRGEVLVEFMVNEEGRVVEPRVVTSTSQVFEEPTLRAVAKWIFEPGKRNGRVVRFRMSVPVVFNLND